MNAALILIVLVALAEIVATFPGLPNWRPLLYSIATQKGTHA